ncbi:Pyridoxal 5'-phosphate synthase subunit snz1 [Bonamia ostreae]|uniref:pyridoxal 5'-phosphate synthase (glutamine hydrolyzing) n=1 Tax=Bonamia ostreae TaxID=126728 RepID=A0ABV2AHE1_9EUKA
MSSKTEQNEIDLKDGMAKMLVGGVIMDVVNAEQAKIAEDAGACSVMALERVPSDIRKDGGVARMTNPKLIQEIIEAVQIPVMAKCRIGHFVEAQILQTMRVYFIDESEVLTIADEEAHIEKKSFKKPFVCGCRNLGEALRRIEEGAAMIRTKGEAGTGNVVEAVRHTKAVFEQIKKLKTMSSNEMEKYAKEIRVSTALVQKTRDLGRLPVVTFAAGGIATPADAALLMQLGVDGVFVGSGIFKSESPKDTAGAIVAAVKDYKDPEVIRKVSEGLAGAMPGLTINDNLLGGYYSKREKE